ncbi:MAG: c-type cytochrome [Cocleimonas sp.]|nr:c-type cytochrome [Cocleimonas sp.]
MNIIKPLVIASTLLLSPTVFANDQHEAGEKLYKTYCVSCHGADVGGMDISKRVAPPIAAVRLHYIGTYPDQTAFVGAISSWMEKQDESKSLMRGAIKKFKIMPPLVLPKNDVAKIAAYIYGGKLNAPKGFAKHVEEEHGKKGMGMGKGQATAEPVKHQEGKHQNDMHKEGVHSKIHAKGKSSWAGKMCHKPHGGMPRMMQPLGLSAQQKQQIQRLIQEKENMIKPLKQALRQISKAIHQLDSQNPNYKAQVLFLADNKATQIYRITASKGEMRQKIESVLTPQQRIKFNQLRQQAHPMKHGQYGMH